MEKLNLKSLCLMELKLLHSTKYIRQYRFSFRMRHVCELEIFNKLHLIDLAVLS
jgi:hypothetical protein